MAVLDPVASAKGTPAAAAAFASSSSPSNQVRPAMPVGAMAMGREAGAPKIEALVSIFDTSTSTRFSSLVSCRKRRLLPSATMSSVPRSRYWNTPLGRRLRATSRRSAML